MIQLKKIVFASDTLKRLLMKSQRERDRGRIVITIKLEMRHGVSCVCEIFWESEREREIWWVNCLSSYNLK